MHAPPCRSRFHARAGWCRGRWLLGAVVALAAVGACGTTVSRGRQARLVSRSAEMDAALGRAERAAMEGDLERAHQMLLALELRARDEGLGPVVTLRRARLAIARGDLVGASEALAGVRAGFDPALDMQRAQVEGLLLARRAEADAAVRVLRPLDGRMIDRAANVEVACGLLAMEPRANGGQPARALRAVAVIEQAREGGTRWLPTGLSCEDTAERADALRTLVARVDDPQVLADTLDAMPPGHALRVELARRLRAVAAQRGEVSRWLRWLADLRDDEATLLPVGADEGAVLRIGVLAPLSGPRANLGMEVVRGVQLAVSGHRAVEVAMADEGQTAASAVAAFDRLVAQQCDGIIGPTQEGFARAVSLRADAAGVEVHLLAPYVDAVDQPGGRVRLAGPSARDRAVALAAAARRVGTRVSFDAAQGGGAEEFLGRLRSVLQLAGVAVVERGEGMPRLVVGPLDQERRTRAAALARRGATRTVIDARAGAPGTPGVWVGVRAAEGFAALHARFCGLTGRPPGELALLAHDAAQALLQQHRGEVPRWALTRFEVTTEALGAAGLPGSVLGVTRPCARTVLPAPSSGELYE